LISSSASLSLPPFFDYFFLYVASHFSFTPAPSLLSKLHLQAAAGRDTFHYLAPTFIFPFLAVLRSS
jgi:hypothetical protein